MLSSAVACLAVLLSQAIAQAATGICDAECQKGCDADCQAAIQAAFAADARDWVGDVATDPFFVTPENISTAVAGDILRWEDVPQQQLTTKWTVPPSTALSRFLYATQDIDGKVIPASAWVLLPYLKPRGGEKFKTVVWTHGTAGRSRQCSTTNHKGLYYNWDAIFSLVDMGFAVVAPDYSGQGSDIPQGFMYEAGFLHVADVAFSLIAARKMLPDTLSDRWVVFGHSEGGMTAWRTNERLAMPGQEALLAAGQFIGAVAAAPALRPQRLIPLSMKAAGNGPAFDPFSVYFLQSLSKLYPDQIKVEDWLGDVPRQRLGVLDNSCFTTGIAAVGNFTPTQLYKSLDWLTLPAVNDWAVRYNGQGPHALAAPMLVIQGTGDTITPAPLTLQDLNETCTAFPASNIQTQLYPDLGHGPVLHAANREIISWIEARFAGIATPCGCATETLTPSTNRFARGGVVYSGVSVNF